MKQQADHAARTGEGFATLLTFGHNYEDQHRPRERVQRERGARPLDALGAAHRAPSFPEGHVSSPHHFLGRLDFPKSGPGTLFTRLFIRYLGLFATCCMFVPLSNVVCPILQS